MKVEENDFVAEIHLDDWEEENGFYIKGKMKIDVDNNLYIDETFIKNIKKYTDLVALEYVVNEEYNDELEEHYLINEFISHFEIDKPSYIVFNKYHNDIFTYDGNVGGGEWDDFLLESKWKTGEVYVINIDSYPSIITESGPVDLMEKTLGESIADHRDAVIEDINI